MAAISHQGRGERWRKMMPSMALLEDEDWVKPTRAPSRVVDVRRKVRGVREVERCRRTLHAASVARELGAFVAKIARRGETCDGFELDVAVVAALGGSHLDDPYLRAQDRLVLVERNYTQLGVLDEIFGRRKRKKRRRVWMN
ncbi:hypothetical protein LXL04_026215 [Taraxacum kok-saghyz]